MDKQNNLEITTHHVMFLTSKGPVFNMDSATDIWQKVLDLLRNDITPVAMETWFKDCTAVNYENGRLYVHTPVALNKQVIDERWLGVIKGTLRDLFSSDDVDFVILTDEDLAKIKKELEKRDFLGINEYTFEHFVVGKSNQFAHAAALAVADGNMKKKGYNPLFIYGNSGLGKTHLLYAIKHEVEKNLPHYKVVYVTGESFTNDLISAIKKGKNIEFREKYRGIDYLLMDDIQFIAGKKETQEEYFNTFNTLYELGKQIVLTSDRPPGEMYLLEDRLQNRFEAGLLADISPPDEALREAIVKSKAEQLGIVLSDDVIKCIAEEVQHNVRKLEGVVKIAMAYRDLMGEEISVEKLKEKIRDAYLKGNDFIPSADDIISETAKYYMIPAEDIKGKSRATYTKNARHMAMYLIRYMTNLPVIEIGKIFDGMHHSSVISAVKKIERNKVNDKKLSNEIRDITSNIQNRSGNI